VLEKYFTTAVPSVVIWNPRPSNKILGEQQESDDDDDDVWKAMEHVGEDSHRRHKSKS